MRVVFMGTPAFAVPSLRKLVGHHDVVAVFTQPDRPRGRGRRVTPSPVKEAAITLSLPVHQPTSLRDPDIVEMLRGYSPDVICVAAYGVILPVEVLEIPVYGCINVHASLLPKHRGAAPIHRAVLAGDEFVGVVTMQMEEGLDTGPYASQRSIPIEDHTVDELTAILGDLGAGALIETLDSISTGNVQWTAQDDAEATYAEKISASDVTLRPELTVVQALRRVRASTPSAKATVCLGDRSVQVLSASASDADLRPGEIAADTDSLDLGFADGSIHLLEVKPAGKAAMPADCFARGARLDDIVSWSDRT